ncbi:MAG: hypothetical protein J6R91_01980 [Bacteroidaceae bacterium]|nr:hypothetical protein [Bacteroidaceae bacterium]
MRQLFYTTVNILLTVIFFSACSDHEDSCTPERVSVHVLFTPDGFCEVGYNDITLKAIETYAQQYGYEYSFCVPETMEDGMDYYQNWYESKLNDGTRSLFIFASNLYNEPLANVPHPTDSRKDILIFEVEEELPYAYTFDITYYGASYMIGSFYLYLYDTPINFLIIAANPYLVGLQDVIDGFTDATVDCTHGNVHINYLDESPDGGLDDDDGAYAVCRVAEYLIPDEMHIFIPYAGASNLGVYRFSQINHSITVGVDCVDPESFFLTYLCMNKKMDLALNDFLQSWIKGEEIPQHRLYTLESGRVVVEWQSYLTEEHNIFDTLLKQAIIKEKEYLENSTDYN